MTSTKQSLALGVVAVFLACLSSAVGYRVLQQQVPFLSTTSPKGSYTVLLTGNPGRAYTVRNKVVFNVSKRESAFVRNASLHSADDAFDLSFEAGYPQHR